MKTDLRNLDIARAARERWEQAIKTGMNHGDVNARWQSYVRLAGKDFAYLEREAQFATDPCISDPSHQFHSHDDDPGDDIPDDGYITPLKARGPDDPRDA